MEFQIKRTSGWSDENPLSENSKFFDKVKEKDGMFMIEINSLEELVALNKEQGDLVLLYSKYTDKHCLEIYDDYRE